MKTIDPEKQRIREKLAAEIRESRWWFLVSKKHGNDFAMIRFKGEIDAFRTAAKIIGK